jgi:hypothetical protein
MEIRAQIQLRVNHHLSLKFCELNINHRAKNFSREKKWLDIYVVVLHEESKTSFIVCKKERNTLQNYS